MVRPLEAAAAWSASLGQMVGFMYACACVCVGGWVCSSGIPLKEGKQTSVSAYLGGAVDTGS